jgi:hypothetical protein
MKVIQNNMSIRWLVAAAILIIGVILGTLQMTKPPVVPADASPTEFSAQRAMVHIQNIAREPHPMGSPEHEDVAGYILGELNSLEMETDVQFSTAVLKKGRPPYLSGQVTNILARIKGSNTGKAVLLSAHYDSYPTSPGASDNGVGVAALLETARLLKTGPSLTNDIIFLFSDGEEMGLLGATAFMAEHPWNKTVKLAVNLDARGSSGPSIMFETGDSSGQLMGEYLKASSWPLAFSYSYEIYRIMQNITDFMVFRDSGLPGFNFAFIGSGHTYDNAFNTIGNVSLSSLQHQGVNALDMARYFGSSKMLKFEKGPNPVFFNIAPRSIINYPKIFAWFLLVLATLLFAGFIIFGIAKKYFIIRNVIISSLVQVLAIIATAVSAFLLWMPVKSTIWQSLTLCWDNWYAMGFLAITGAVILIMQQVLLRKYNDADVMAGYMVFWWLFSALTTIYVTGASYLFIWPLFGNIAWLAIKLFIKKENSYLNAISILVTIIPIMVLFVPALYLTYIGISLDLIAGLAAFAAIPLGMIFAILSAYLGFNKKIAAAVFLAVSILFIGGRSFVLAFGPKQFSKDTIIYCLNVDQDKAVWASIDKKPDIFTSQFLGKNPSRGPIGDYLPGMGERPFLMNEAPTVNLPPPEVKIISDSNAGDSRRLRMILKSPRRAGIMTVEFDPETEITETAINGKSIELSREKSFRRWLFINYALPPDGMELVLMIRNKGKLRFTAVDQSNGLPEIEGIKYEKRPGYLTPGPIGIRDGTFVAKRYEL